MKEMKQYLLKRKGNKNCLLCTKMYMVCRNAHLYITVKLTTMALCF